MTPMIPCAVVGWDRAGTGRSEALIGRGRFPCEWGLVHGEPKSRAQHPLFDQGRPKSLQRLAHLDHSVVGG